SPSAPIGLAHGAVLACRTIMWRGLWPLFDRGILRRMTPHQKARRRAMQAAARLAEPGHRQPGERVWVVRCEGAFPFACWSWAHQAVAAPSVREAWAKLEGQGWYLAQTQRAGRAHGRPVCPDCLQRSDEFLRDDREVDEGALVWSR
ncbi:MAG: hypothetical protein ACRENE_10415, partial [Polyangiaceae bacterium]